MDGREFIQAGLPLEAHGGGELAGPLPPSLPGRFMSLGAR